MVLNRVKNISLLVFFIITSFCIFALFNEHTIINVSNDYEVQLTYYYPGDATGSTTHLGSGVSMSSLTLDSNGWYHYMKDGMDYLVIAAATTYCRDLSNHCGVSIDLHGMAKSIPYYNYGDVVHLTIGGTSYQAMILDSCGACMWGKQDTLGEKFDIFSSRGAVNPAIYLTQKTGDIISNISNQISSNTTYEGDIRQGYIYKKQLGNAITELESQTEEKLKNKITNIIGNIYSNASKYTSIVKRGAAAYIANVTYLAGTFKNQIIYFNQGDYANYNYGSYGTIKSHGCGPTSMAIVASSFKGTAISPVETTNYACSHGYCTSAGSSHAVVCALASQYGLGCTGGNGLDALSSTNQQQVVDALASGNSLVVVLAKQGHFTRGGHFFVLTGIDSSGNITVADPGNRANNNKTFTLNYLINPSQGHVTKFWIISG